MWIWKQTGIIAQKDISNCHKKRVNTFFLFFKKTEKIVDKQEMMLYNTIINKNRNRRTIKWTTT